MAAGRRLSARPDETLHERASPVAAGRPRADSRQESPYIHIQAAIHLSIYPSIHLSIYLSSHPSIHPYVSGI
ncbi:MAG: hypothetical protein ABGY24_09630, partial [bacterium]